MAGDKERERERDKERDIKREREREMYSDRSEPRLRRENMASPAV